MNSRWSLSAIRSAWSWWAFFVVIAGIALVLGGSYLVVTGLARELQIYPQKVLVEDAQPQASLEQGSEIQKEKPSPTTITGEHGSEIQEEKSSPTTITGEHGSEIQEEKSVPTTITVEGIVLHDWNPISESNVWVTVNSYAVGSDTTKNDGTFQIKGTVHTLEPLSKSHRDVTIAIYAKGGMQDDKILEKLAGRATLGGQVPLTFRGSAMVPLLPAGAALGLFLLGLAVAFKRANTADERRRKHTLSTILAIAFTLAMIGTIALGLMFVHTLEEHVDILSLGYGYVFWGTYVDMGDHPHQQWIFSFTTPPHLVGEQDASHGFGAPLWVILLAVIGAALATVQLIIAKTRETLSYEDKDVDDFRARIQGIVEHQFFILFAPLGAIFVYQMLVAGEAANQHLTVALAALGSGPAVNFVLARAFGAAQKLVGR